MLIIFHILLVLKIGRKYWIHIYLRYVFKIHCHLHAVIQKRHLNVSLLLIIALFSFSGCTDDHIFETKTVGVGQNVTLTCTRQRSWHSTYLFWIRLVSGTFPEFLGGTLAIDLEVVEQTRHITAKQEPGTFVLHITETQLSDTAVYYCIKVKKLSMIFLKGIFLRIKGKYSKKSNRNFRITFMFFNFLFFYTHKVGICCINMKVIRLTALY